MSDARECLICGQALEYLQEQQEMVCSFCGKTFLSNTKCRDGHYICDACHEKKGLEEVMHICGGSESKNPLEILQKIMECPYIYMHGPEHHVMIGAALLTAWHNGGGQIDFPAALEEMKKRGSQIPGGICGLWGTCGAAVSAGIFFSIVTSSSPMSSKTWGLGNQLTSRCLDAIGSLGGPRCCKRDSFTAVSVSIDFIQEHLGISLEKPERISCTFSSQNGQCIRLRCPYHAGGSRRTEINCEMENLSDQNAEEEC